MVSPIVDEIATEQSDIKVGKINVDEQMELAAAFQVMSIPTLVVMKDGKVSIRPWAQDRRLRFFRCCKGGFPNEHL